MTTSTSARDKMRHASLWDWFCYLRSQRHAKAALDAMSRFDYARARWHIERAKRWELRRHKTVQP